MKRKGWKEMRSEWEEEFERRNREACARQRERSIEQAVKEGVQRLILPLPNGGEETIDLRLQ